MVCLAESGNTTKTRQPYFWRQRSLLCVCALVHWLRPTATGETSFTLNDEIHLYVVLARSLRQEISRLMPATQWLLTQIDSILTRCWDRGRIKLRKERLLHVRTNNADKLLTMGFPLDYNIIEAHVSGSAEFELVLERLTFERRASLISTAKHNPSYRASFQGIFFGFLTLRK